MKKTMIAVILLISGGFLFAQERHHDVPDQVRQNFQHDYPDARQTHWNQSNGHWHASFNDQSPRGRGEMIAHYDQDGRHLDSHIPYDDHDVPPAIMEHLQNKYRRGHYRFERIEAPDNTGFFRVMIRLGGRNRIVFMNEQGEERPYEDRH